MKAASAGVESMNGQSVGSASNEALAIDAVKAERTIQSIERALDLLDILAAADRELGLSEIAAEARLNSSTCHHLLATLVKRGYVGRNKRSRTYFLGARITELSNSRLKHFNLTEIAMPELRALNEATGECVHLAVMQGYALVTLAKLDSRLPVRVGADQMSNANAAHATATGKAILAWLPEAEIARVIANNGLGRFTENTIGTIAGLMEELRLTRRHGYSMDDEEFQPGVVCVGAAIRDHAGAVIGSAACSMPAMRANAKARETVKAAVKLCAAAISEKFGGVKNDAAAGRVDG
ncbi:MAG: IclR family transcriptional regulator [Rhodomicrobiaceae bacterium]